MQAGPWKSGNMKHLCRAKEILPLILLLSFQILFTKNRFLEFCNFVAKVEKNKELFKFLNSSWLSEILNEYLYKIK